MGHKFYAVVKGFEVGIYDTWYGGAAEQVTGFPRAIHRRFTNRDDAERWYIWMTKKSLSPKRQLTAVERQRHGYAVMVMLKPNGAGDETMVSLGANFFDGDSEEAAEERGLAEFWSDEHARKGTPVVRTIFLEGRDVIFFVEGGYSMDNVPMCRPVKGRWVC
jgi:hypothetical protein